jgi:hypothetical protein
MKNCLPGDTLRFVTGSYRRGGPLGIASPIDQRTLRRLGKRRMITA